jgi:hypothetical protein
MRAKLSSMLISMSRAQLAARSIGLIADEKLTPIQPGMTVQANITTDSRRVIEFLLSAVVKYMDVKI